MHRVESDNVGKDSQGRNIFADGPPGTTINAAIMNALQEEICNVIEGYGLTLRTKLNDSHGQLWQVIQAMLNKNNRAATYVFASSDSEAKSQAGADQIISTSADAAAIIKAKAAELSALGGGTILCMEGTYNCYSELTWSSYVDLIGCGYRTSFRRAADFSILINTFASQYYNLRNFLIDGNKAIYTGAGTYYGLYGNASNFLSHVYDLISINEDDYGFFRINNVINCISSGSVYGFSQCNNLVDCIADSNSSYGFATCNQMTNCAANNGGASAQGFYICKILNNCSSNNNGLDGFSGCFSLNNCKNISSSRHGFQLCTALVGCINIANAASAYPFTSCYPMQQCCGSTASAWRSCFADWSGVTATANSAIGGYNLA